MIFLKPCNKFSNTKKFKEANNGFEYLKESNNLGLWRNLKESFLKKPPSNSKKFSKFIFGESAYANSEIIIHQYLIDKVIKVKLYNKVLQFLSNKQPFSYPLPPIWQDEIIKNSIFLNKSFSNILFWFHVIINYIRSIYIGLKLFFIFSPNNYKLNKSNKNVHFVGLNKNNLPSTNIPENNYDLITWYITHSKKNKLTILHDVDISFSHYKYLNCEIQYAAEPTRYITGIINKFKFISWLFISILISLKDLFLGRWHNAYILGEAIKSKAVNLNNNLADIYLFQFSSQAYRPMWTYELESRKIETICYFYATFEQPTIIHNHIIVTNTHDFYLYNWPYSFFWDKYHYKMIQNCCKYFVKGEITGPIWFTDSTDIPVKYEKPYVVVFDIPPHRKYFHFGISSITDYFEYNKKVHCRFLQDIVECADELGILVLHKIKRDIGRRSEKNYTQLISNLKKSKTYILASTNISPIKLIDNSIAVISMPFTSTAIYGRDRNKPSIYYDPVNYIKNYDSAAHDIAIVNGKKMLREWLTNNLVYCD